MDEHSESEEDQWGWGAGARVGGARRLDPMGQRGADIINILERDQLINFRRVNANNQPRQQADWSEEESQVQNMLMNLRGLTSSIMRPDRGVERIYGGRQDRPGANGRQVEVVPAKVNILEQMFEGIKVIGYSELFDIVSGAKSAMDQEMQFEESKLKHMNLANQEIGLLRRQWDVQRADIMELLSRQAMMRGAEDYDVIDRMEVMGRQQIEELDIEMEA